MNSSPPRIYLTQKSHQSAESQKFSIHDNLDKKKIGFIRLKSNKIKSIKVKPQSQKNYVATQAILLLLQKLKQNLTCKIKKDNIPAIKLFRYFSEPTVTDSNFKFNIECKTLIKQSWDDLYLNKLNSSDLVISNHNSHQLINLTAQLIYGGKDIFNRDFHLHPIAFKAWSKMSKQARKEGIDLQIVSAFRSLQYQNQLIQNKINKGILIEDIIKVNTLAGYSEHHSGCAIDIGSKDAAILETEFENSEAFSWLKKNASKYNFKLSYPRNNDSGIIYEPWHWCYNANKQ